MENTQKPSFLKIARSFSIFPSKKFGQHFLINEGALRQIIKAASISPDETVLEIGPGIGNLTWYLSREAAFIIAIEKDLRMKIVLDEVLKSTDNVFIFYRDALKINLEGEISEKKLPIPQKTVSNLPYQIASTLIVEYLTKYDFLRTYVLMVQKEVAERIVAMPGIGAYGGLTLKIKAFADAKVIMNLKPDSFYPPPEVDSSVILLERKKRVEDYQLYFKIINASFRHRRKKIINSITSSEIFNIEKERAEEILEIAGIIPDERAENIGFDRFFKFYELIRKKAAINELKMTDS